MRRINYTFLWRLQLWQAWQLRQRWPNRQAGSLIDSDSVAGSAVRILEDHSIMLHQQTVNFTIGGVQGENSIVPVVVGESLSLLRSSLLLSAVVDDVEVSQTASVTTFPFSRRHLARQEVARLGAVVPNVRLRCRQKFCPPSFSMMRK